MTIHTLPVLTFNQHDGSQTDKRELIEQLFKNNKIESISFPEGWSEYEENLEYENAHITFDNGTLLIATGYHAMYEMLSYHKLNQQQQLIFQNDLLDNMLWYYDHE